MPIKFQFFKNLVLKCVDFWFLLGGLRQDVKGTSHIPETYFLNELFSKLYSGDIMSVCEMKQNDFKTRICEIALSERWPSAVFQFSSTSYVVLRFC